MKIFFPNSHEDRSLLGPLQELRSPVSMTELRSIVANEISLSRNAGKYFFWPILETIALFSLAGILWTYSTPIPRTHTFLKNISSSVPLQNNGTPASLEPPNNTRPNSIPHFFASHSHVQPVVSSTEHIENSENDISEVAPRNLTNPIFIDDRDQNNAPKFVANNSEAAPIDGSWSLKALGGAVFSHLRLADEGVEIEKQNGWNSFDLLVMNSAGSRDGHDILAHKSSSVPLVKSESNQQIALLASLNFSVGPVGIELGAGPAYSISALNTVIPSTGITGPMITNRAFGALGQLSASYEIANSFHVGLSTTLSIFRGQIQNGAMLTFAISP